MTSADLGRRSSMEIIASILDACRRSRRKYHVMYTCNMSSPQFRGYLDMLLKANLVLIEIDRGHLWLRASDKGKDFLKAFNGVKTMLE